MSRWPVAAFVALVIATIGAFFVTQHLKVTTPLIAGFPRPVPSSINPVNGGSCRVRNPAGELVRVSFKQTRVSFYLLHRADNVEVYIVNSAGTIVDTLPGSGARMTIGKRRTFVWSGREDSGSVAPAGQYTIRVSLVHQGRSVPIVNQDTGAAEPVTVETGLPKLRITGVTAAGQISPALIPLRGDRTVTIHYTGTGGLRPRILIYRTDLPGGPRLVKSYAATSTAGHSVWDGTLAGGVPAPQGTYLVRIELTDAACTTAYDPAVIPPPPGSTPDAGVTVRYLAAEPPLVPTTAGADAVVDVDARGQVYRWTLRRPGAARILRSGTTRVVALRVPLPAGAAGLYELGLGWGSHTTAVPLVASAPVAARAPILVVLPALTWQGLDPVDDTGDGLPDTLIAGQPVRLARPLVDGLPAGLGDELALQGFLRRTGHAFDLTTDLGLIEGVGPALAGHRGVVLAGSELWLPPSLGTALRTYVEQGGHVLSLGIGSMLRAVTISGGVALDPTAPSATDALLARPGPVTPTHGALILVSRDALHIFSGTSQALPDYSSYQPIGSVAAPAAIASAAGISSAQPAIVGYRLGRGIVIDIGLPGFASSLASSLDARQLLERVWNVLEG